MRRNFFTATILLLSYYTIYGQISTNEEPISFRTNIPTLRGDKNTLKTLSSLDMKKIEQEDRKDEANGIPPRFGYRHEVNYNLENSGEWVDLPDGDKIWRLVISCSGALSINLLYDKFWIPDGAKFFIYSNNRRHNIGAFTSVNNKGSRDDMQGFATGLVYGDQVTLEYYLPNDVKEVGIISISGIIHGYRYILPEFGYGNVPGGGFNWSGNCQVNVNCPEGNNWQNEKRAVALILVNGNRYCTGSLINNTNNDYSPYFLTADHCLGDWGNNHIKYDAINNPNLNHWTFYWNYELPPNPNDCNYNNSSPSAPLAFSTSGAKVVANEGLSVSDFALLKLIEDPICFLNHTPKYIPYYLGWDRTGNSGTGGVGIHHPAGDVKKIATHNQTPQTYSVSGGSYWRLYWMQTPNGHSVTEGGSSGSFLINNNRRIIGQLYGTNGGDCSNPTNKSSIYGKFSASWTGNGATDNRRKIQPWLDANNTVTTLDGIDPCSTTSFTTPTVSTIQTVTGGNINVQNVTVTSGATLTIKAVCDINVQGVTVKNNSKLILDAGGEVNIISDFDVQLGSEFEIKYL